MEDWGVQIKRAVEGVSEILAVGLGLDRDTLTKAAEWGSHLLAPTATDLRKFGKEGESTFHTCSHSSFYLFTRDETDVPFVLSAVFAGFHTDLNFLTIHGRSRYPGLNIWARNSGKRIEVKLPPGCLLVQAGKQLEHLTGGLILAGYHEVICSSATVAALERRRSDPSTASRPEIRISSTFFYHLSNDYPLEPRAFLDKVKGSEVVKKEKAKASVGEAGEAEWDVNARDGKYEEGMMVGTLIQVSLARNDCNPSELED